MKFEELGAPPHIVEALHRHGITVPTLVQEKAIPPLMAGKDVAVRAKTGSGKTIAFLIPMLHRIEARSRNVQALILAPTRELALQVGKDLQMVDSSIRQIVLYGGVGIAPQIRYLQEGCSVVIGTPGRILDHLSRGTLNLSGVRFAVLDEADRMLDMGFIEDVRDILKKTPSSRQTMLFSATMPAEILYLSRNYMRNPEKLILDQDEIIVKEIHQEFYGCAPRQKLDALFMYMKQHHAKITKTLIFCNTKHWVDSLSRILYGKGFSTNAIHSGISQNQRERIMDDFKAGKFHILVATDVAARGLHIPEVSHVINYDLPKTARDYIHRIGRTGRAGASGHAISLLVTADTSLLRDIERETDQRIDVKDVSEMLPPGRQEHGNERGQEYGHQRQQEHGRDHGQRHQRQRRY